MTKTTAAVLAATTVLALPAAASAGGIFGSYPLNISVAPNGAPANGDSSAPAVSGDNRRTRYAAFQSDASNLVGGDTNGVTDVLVWSRPRGSAGLTLPRGSGSLQRASVASNGAQANGPSRRPSLDGSVDRGARCVAFESDASNLAAGDRDNVTDVFVRDLRARRTFLVSRGVAAPATDPSIDGACRRVAFVAAGRVRVAPVRRGRVRSLGAGASPDYALDGRAIAWERGGTVMLVRDGRRSRVGPGQNPTVTDAERLSGMKTPSWGVSFDTARRLSRRDDNPGVDTYLRVFGARGGVKRTDLISYAQPKVDLDGRGDNRNGGITAYGTNRGIITFVHSEANASSAFYWNQNSGNADDLAHAAARPAQPGISELVTSARANFVAFTSSFAGDMGSPFTGLTGRGLPVSLESLFTPQTNVYFKHLTDGERL